MSPEGGSVSRWFGPLQQGDPAAAQQLWELYFQRLIELARKKLRDLPHREAAEDVALSAFDSFCRSASLARFPQLADRDSLWRLLVIITARKAAHHKRDERRQKRNRPRGNVGDTGLMLEEIVGREPTPEFAAQAAEECQRLLRLLGDSELERLAILKMDGHTLGEIAQQLGYAERTIKRKLRLIRSLWEQELVS